MHTLDTDVVLTEMREHAIQVWSAGISGSVFWLLERGVEGPLQGETTRYLGAI